MKLRKEKSARRLAWWLDTTVDVALRHLRGAKSRARAHWLATGDKLYPRPAVSRPR